MRVKRLMPEEGEEMSKTERGNVRGRDRKHKKCEAEYKRMK